MTNLESISSSTRNTYTITISKYNITQSWTTTIDTFEEFVSMVQRANDAFPSPQNIITTSSTIDQVPTVESKQIPYSDREDWNEAVSMVLQHIKAWKHKVYELKLNSESELLLLNCNEFMGALNKMKDWLLNAREHISNRQYTIIETAIEEYSNMIENKKQRLREYLHHQPTKVEESKQKFSANKWNEYIDSIENVLDQAKSEGHSNSTIKETILDEARKYITSTDCNMAEELLGSLNDEIDRVIELRKERETFLDTIICDEVKDSPF